MRNNNLFKRDIRHFLDNTYTQEEAERVFDQLRKENLENIFDECINDAWDESKSSFSGTILEYYQNKKEAAVLLRRIKRTHRSFSSYLLHPLLIAASIIVVCAITVGVYKYSQNKALQSIYTLTQSTTTGERKTISLPDGTVVTLNTCSRIKYPNKFLGKNRKVMLEGGAYFKVVHNSSMPFIVNTYYKNTNIKVLGTTFNVDAYPQNKIIEATLIEGRISFEGINEKGETTKTILSPTEKLTYNTSTNNVFVQNVDTKDETAWMDGRIVFRNSPILEVTRKLSKLYNVDFKLDGEIIKSYSFTGDFSEDSLSQVLEYMRISSGIDYKIIHNTTQSGKDLIVLRINRSTM